MHTAADGSHRPQEPKITNENPDPSKSPCPERVVTQAPSEPRVMLDELGYVTPVVDQKGRGSCDAFGATEALESAYLVEHYKMTSDEFTAKYGHPLLLSEEYMIGAKTDGTYAFHDSGSATTNLQRLAPYCGGAPMMGLPLASAWPYVATDAAIEELMMKSVPGAPADTAGLQALVGITGPTAPNGLSPSLNLDSGRLPVEQPDFKPKERRRVRSSPCFRRRRSTSRPRGLLPGWWTSSWLKGEGSRGLRLSVAELSDYAPVTASASPAGGASAACLEALAAPLEKVLSGDHAPGRSPSTGTSSSSTRRSWGLHLQQSGRAQSDVFGSRGPARAVMIARRKLLKIKNSWGTQWAVNGFAYVTFDLLLRTVNDSSYVEQVFDVAKSAVPNMVLARLVARQDRKIAGVAAIHHLLGDSSVETGELPPGIFYGEDGSKTSDPTSSAGSRRRRAGA